MVASSGASSTTTTAVSAASITAPTKEKDGWSIDGKFCMVTGANSGIGKVVSRELARMGANVIMVCRNESKGEAARSEVRGAAASSDSVELMLADLSSLASVRKLADEYRSKFDGLDVLVNNAGLIIGGRRVTPDGLEETFVVNYLSHFLLTNLLLDLLVKSAPSRVVNVTSSAHYSGHMDFDDLQGTKRYGAMRAYCQSKLAQVLFTHELSRRVKDKGVTVNCVHPGAVRTSWGDEAGVLGLGIRLARPFMISPERGAETVVYLASSPRVSDVSGEFFSKKKAQRSSEESYSDEEARRLWDESMKLSGLAAVAAHDAATT
jgi:NAD(P)-dependent dehydrogenase (short-subunit alcohol dehydrogenase family)